MYIDIDEVRWDMPPDHNLNSSGEYRSMRWFTPIFPQRIMRHFKFFLQQIHSTRCLAGKNPPTSQRKSDQRQAPRCAHHFQLVTVYTSLNSLEKRWLPPLVDGQLMWTYHTTSVFYDWWPWWFIYIHFKLPKLSEPLTATPFFFAWLLSFHHMFLLEPPMAQFQNKTYPSKSLVRSTHVKPLYFSKWSTPPISIIYSQFFTVNPC